MLLAASVPEPAGARRARLVDVGAGVGVVGLCAAVRLPGLDVSLVEQSRPLSALAARNIAENALADRARVVCQDVTLRPRKADVGTAEPPELADNSFDIVVSNPPFYAPSDHRPSPHALKAGAHAMPEAGLDAWVRFMARMTRPGGTAIMIHRTDGLAAMLAAFGRRFGALTLLPFHPREGEAASRVILRGIRGSRAPLTLAPGITLHGAGNRFTPSVERILKTPASLDF